MTRDACSLALGLSFYFSLDFCCDSGCRFGSGLRGIQDDLFGLLGLGLCHASRNSRCGIWQRGRHSCCDLGSLRGSGRGHYCCNSCRSCWNGRGHPCCDLCGEGRSHGCYSARNLGRKASRSGGRSSGNIRCGIRHEICGEGSNLWCRGWFLGRELFYGFYKGVLPDFSRIFDGAFLI